jgi:hypothetical protein
MTNYGMKVSEEGYDVLTALDKNLILKTDLTMFKVFMSGSGSVTGNTWYSVTHSLGYRPQFLVYLESTTQANNMKLATASWTDGIARVDTTKLYFLVTAAGTYDAYYYIFYEGLSV